MNAHHPLKAALRRLRSGKAEAESCAVIKTLLARIRAALTLDEVLMEGFPGIKTLDDDQALEYWTGKASKHGRGNLQEDDLDVGSLVMIKGVAPDTTGDMPWDAPRTQLVGHSARVLAIHLPFVLLEMADNRAFSSGPLSLDIRLVALMRSGEEYFNAQRGVSAEGNAPVNKPEVSGSLGVNDSSLPPLPF